MQVINNLINHNNDKPPESLYIPGKLSAWIFLFCSLPFTDSSNVTGKNSILNAEIPLYWFACCFGTYSTTCEIVLSLCLIYIFTIFLGSTLKLPRDEGLQNMAACK